MISVIILTKNSAKELPRALLCLKQAVEFFAYELIVVDGMSSDETINIAKEMFPNAKILTETKMGLSYARYMGFKASKGEYVAYVDSDICVPKDFFVRVLQDFELDRKIGAVAAKFFPFPEYDRGALNRYYRSLKEEHLGQEVSRFVLFFGTACTIIRRDVLERVKFDYRFKGAAEDKHITRQITEMGFKLFFDSSICCEHIRPSTVWAEMKRYYQHGYYAPLYAKLHDDETFRRQILGTAMYVASLVLPFLIPVLWIARLRSHREKKLAYGIVGYFLTLSRRIGTLIGCFRWRKLL